MRLGYRREQWGDAVDAYNKLQGGSLRTWAQRGPSSGSRTVHLGTEGRPLDAEVEIWHGPDDTPCQMRVYSENGQLRPFNAVIGQPGDPGTVAVRNVGEMELPMTASVTEAHGGSPSPSNAMQGEAPTSAPTRGEAFRTIQGGALRTYPFQPNVESVQVDLKSQGMPIYAVVELLQGPNSNRQAIELYTDNGFKRPIFYILETPGRGCVVSVTNTGPVEFPLTASVVPHFVNQDTTPYGAVVGGNERRRRRCRYDLPGEYESEYDPRIESEFGREYDRYGDGSSNGGRPHFDPRQQSCDNLQNPMAFGTDSVPSYTHTQFPETPVPAAAPPQTAELDGRVSSTSHSLPEKAEARESAADVVARVEAMMQAL